MKGESRVEVRRRLRYGREDGQAVVEAALIAIAIILASLAIARALERLSRADAAVRRVARFLPGG